MPSLGKNTTNYLVLLASLVCIFLLYLYLKDWEKSAIYVSVVCLTILFIGLLFFKFEWYYLLAIGLIPLSLETALAGGAKLGLPSEAMLFLAVPVTFLFGKTNKRLIELIRHPVTIIILIDLLVQLFATLVSTHIDVSFKRLIIRIIFVLGFYFFIQLGRDRRIYIFTFMAYCIGLIPVMYFTFRNHIHHDFNPRVVFSICQPYFNDHTIYGACLAFVLPFLLIILIKRKLFLKKQIYFIGVLLLTIAILASEILALSRAAILSLIVAAIFYLALHYKVKFRSLILVLLVAGLSIFAFKDVIYSKIERNDAVSNDGQIANHFTSVTNVQSDASNLERINRWICAYRMFKEKPILGYGPGTYQFEYNQFQTMENKTYISTNSGNRGNAHSEYLTYLSETGIFGFLIFICTVLAAIYYGMQNHYNVQDEYLKMINLTMLLGLVTFFFHGVFNSFIDQSKMAFLYFGALGVIVQINIQHRIKQKETT